MSVLVKNKYIYLFIGHIIIFILVVLHLGVNISNEGEKFIGEAKLLLGQDIDYILKYQLLNLSYIVYLIPFLALGIPLKIIVFFTHTLTLFSYYRFSSFLKKRYGERVAFNWLAFVLLCPVLIYWNLSLYSESFFIAISLLFLTSVFKLNRTAFIYGSILLFARPAGIFIVLLAAILKWIYFDDFSLKRTLTYLSVILFGGFIFVFFFVKMHFLGVTKEILAGSVICGFPKHEVPEHMWREMSLFDAYRYYVATFGYTDLLTVLAKRFVSYFNMTRPYYSPIHNMINVLWSLFFVSNVIAFVKVKHYFNEILFVQVFIILNCLMIMLFFNGWSERYTVVVLPFLFFTSALYIDHLRKKKRDLI